MAKKQNAKKGKRRRVHKDKIARYWSVNHVPNMVRRAVRVFRTNGAPAADRFVSLHSNGCGHCAVILDARFRQIAL